MCVHMLIVVCRCKLVCISRFGGSQPWMALIIHLPFHWSGSFDGAEICPNCVYRASYAFPGTSALGLLGNKPHFVNHGFVNIIRHMFDCNIEMQTKHGWQDEAPFYTSSSASHEQVNTIGRPCHGLGFGLMHDRSNDTYSSNITLCVTDLHIYIYIYIYVCMCVCVYVCMCVCVYVCMCVCAYVCMCVYNCIYIHAYVYIFEYIYIYIYTAVYVYVYLCVCMCSYMFIWPYIYIYIACKGGQGGV